MPLGKSGGKSGKSGDAILNSTIPLKRVTQKPRGPRPWSRSRHVRIDTIASSATPSASQTYAAYTYLGAGTVVQVAHPAVAGGLNLTYKGLVDGLYPGFDRFGRVIWQAWTTDDRSAPVDRYFYGYDRDSNMTWRAERGPWYAVEAPARDEAYVYDGLGRLVKSVRGVLMADEAGDPICPQYGDADEDGDVDLDDLNLWEVFYFNDLEGWQRGDFDGNSTVDLDDLNSWELFWFNPVARTVAGTSEWDLGALGNWAGYREDAGDGTPTWDLNQTRITNAANEITSVSGGWITPEYDDAGNMISGPKPGDETTRLHFAYDGWNRLTAVHADDAQNPGQPGAILVAYEYDGQGRRIERTVGETTEDSYYNESWQVLEVRSDGVVAEQYLWDQMYVDTPVLRWQYDGTNVETLYYTTDAQHNVTALVSAAGTVVERYSYSPYGKPEIHSEDWTPDADGQSNVSNTILFASYGFDAATGLYHTDHREYHYSLAIFTAKDPAEVGLNHYEYCFSNPIRYTDPTGLCPPDMVPVLGGFGFDTFSGPTFTLTGVGGAGFSPGSADFGATMPPEVWARIGGGCKLVVGIGMGVSGLGFAFLTATTGAGAFAGGAFAVYGADVAGSGWNDLCSGTTSNTATNQSLRSAGEAAGLSRCQAAFAADTSEMVLCIGGSMGLSVATSAARAGTLSLQGSVRSANCVRSYASGEAQVLASQGRPTSALRQRYVSGSGGRWGSNATRLLNDRIATQLESQGFRITGGAGRASEELIRGPGGGTLGGTWVDITATDGVRTIRVQTYTTMADGITPTASEAAAAERIRAAFPNDRLCLIPK